MVDLLHPQLVGERHVAMEQFGGSDGSVELQSGRILVSASERLPELLRLATLAHGCNAVSRGEQTTHILSQVLQLRRAVLPPLEKNH